MGSVALSDPALGAALAVLRAQAEAAAPSGLRSLLLLPQSQILFTDVALAPEGGAAQEALIRAALEGRTPYALHELVFDWQAREGRCAVAVIARETLDEAESFAKAHGFHPVSFAAWPAPGLFDGPPWFGPTAGAAAELPPGQSVAREKGPFALSPPGATPSFASRRAAPMPDAPPVASPMAPPVAAAPQAPAPEATGHRPRLTPRPPRQGPSLGAQLRALWARLAARRPARRTRPEGPVPDPRARLAAGAGRPAAPSPSRALRRGPSVTGLVLTGALLLALAAVAAWSSYYLAATGQIESSLTPEGAGATDLAENSPETGALPTPDEEMLADGEDPALLLPEAPMPVEPETLAEAAPEPLPVPRPEVIEDRAEALPPAPKGPGRAESATDLAQGEAPPPPEPVAAALPEPEPAPQVQALQPTPDGVLTPEGVMLYQGKPPLLPPARPASLQKPVEDGAGAAAEPATDLAAAAPEARPEARPGDDLALPLAPLPVDPRLAGARPRARPLTAEALADAARTGSETASLALGGQGPNGGPASPYAVALSARPAPRPGNFSQAVEAAVTAALQDSGSPLALAAPEGADGATIRLREPTAEELAALDPGQLDEPEPVAEAPRAPISGSVAKRATFVNGFNLSKTGLIGVYGTASRRYALVRQSNGRIKRVEVGDKVEGGVVAAITADELRYQKGGRIYALKIPSG